MIVTDPSSVDAAYTVIHEYRNYKHRIRRRIRLFLSASTSTNIRRYDLRHPCSTSPKVYLQCILHFYDDTPID